MRLVVLIAVLFSASPALAEDAPKPADDRKLDPEEGLPKPDPEDLRAGHWLLSASGGVWVPSPSFTPDVPGLGNFDAAGLVEGHVGVGINRYLVLGVDGGYARFVGANCDGCSGDGFNVGASMSFYPTQAFAFEPWARYGIGYRRTSLSLTTEPSFSFHAIEVARLAIGGTYFPISSLGFGPYVGADLAIRNPDAPVFYAAFNAGMTLTFDPVRIGTTVRPQVATR